MVGSFLTPSLSLVGHSPQRVCVSVHQVLFSLGIKGNFCFLGILNLLVGSVYHVKNEVFIMRLFDRTGSIYPNLAKHQAN